MSVSAKKLKVFMGASLRSCALAHAFTRRTRSGNLVSMAATCFRATVLKAAVLFPTAISHSVPAAQHSDELSALNARLVCNKTLSPNVYYRRPCIARQISPSIWGLAVRLQLPVNAFEDFSRVHHADMAMYVTVLV
jgi:hypothetical protein